jgi:chromate transporter
MSATESQVGEPTPEDPPTGTLAEVAWVFGRLGTIAFGGPAAHIALMRQEVVHRRRWLGEQSFLDLLGAANLIPGPNSTELAIHLGHRRAGWPGLVVAGVCFILPALLIVLAIAWAYVGLAPCRRSAGFCTGSSRSSSPSSLKRCWGCCGRRSRVW